MTAEDPLAEMRSYLQLQAEVASIRERLASAEEKLRLAREKLERIAGLPTSKVTVEHAWHTYQSSPLGAVTPAWGTTYVNGAIMVETPMQTFTYAPVTGASFVVNTEPSLAARVLDCLFRNTGRSMSPADVATDLDAPANVVRATLSRLASDGKIERLGHGRYCVRPRQEGARAPQ